MVTFKLGGDRVKWEAICRSRQTFTVNKDERETEKSRSNLKSGDDT